MRQVLFTTPNKTHPRGRSRQDWLDQVKKDLNHADKTVKIEEWKIKIV